MELLDWTDNGNDSFQGKYYNFIQINFCQFLCLLHDDWYSAVKILPKILGALKIWIEMGRIWIWLRMHIEAQHIISQDNADWLQGLSL